MTIEVAEGERRVNAAGNSYVINVEGGFYKVRLSLEEYERDSIKMAERMLGSGFVPDMIIPIGRGGFLPYLFIEKLLEGMVYRPDVFPIVTNSYTGTGKRKDDIDIFLVEEAIETIRGKRPDIKHGNRAPHERILLIDDVDDQLLTARAVTNKLTSAIPDADIRRAVVYRKPYAKRTDASEPFPTINFEIEYIDGDPKKCWIVFPT